MPAYPKKSFESLLSDCVSLLSVFELWVSRSLLARCCWRTRVLLAVRSPVWTNHAGVTLTSAKHRDATASPTVPSEYGKRVVFRRPFLTWVVCRARRWTRVRPPDSTSCVLCPRMLVCFCCCSSCSCPNLCYLPLISARHPTSWLGYCAAAHQRHSFWPDDGASPPVLIRPHHRQVCCVVRHRLRAVAASGLSLRSRLFASTRAAARLVSALDIGRVVAVSDVGGIVALSPLAALTVADCTSNVDSALLRCRSARTTCCRWIDARTASAACRGVHPSAVLSRDLPVCLPV